MSQRTPEDERRSTGELQEPLLTPSGSGFEAWAKGKMLASVDLPRFGLRPFKVDKSTDSIGFELHLEESGATSAHLAVEDDGWQSFRNSWKG